MHFYSGVDTVTDLDTAGTNIAAILAGLTNVTLTATAGVAYVVNDVSGGTNHVITLGGGADMINLDGGHTDLNIDLSLGLDTLNVTGIASGTLNGGPPAVTPGDKLHLNNTADISGATTISFEDLDVQAGASVKMTGTTWDQFVETTGAAKANHTVSGTGAETVDITSTTNLVTTAYTGANRIENYTLSSNANDFFRVNNADTAAANQVKVTLTGAGSDFLALNDATATLNDEDVRTTVTNFASGAGGDIAQLQLNGASLSSGGFLLITAMDTNVAIATQTLVINSNVTLMDDTWTAGEARTALNVAIANIDAGDYVAAIYFAGGSSGAYLVGFTTAMDDPGNATVDLIGVLSSVAVNTLTSNNFS